MLYVISVRSTRFFRGLSGCGYIKAVGIITMLSILIPLFQFCIIHVNLFHRFVRQRQPWPCAQPLHKTDVLFSAVKKTFVARCFAAPSLHVFCQSDIRCQGFPVFCHFVAFLFQRAPRPVIEPIYFLINLLRHAGRAVYAFFRLVSRLIIF